MSYSEKQSNLIKQQLRTNGVLDETVLALFETVPREAFVPSAYQSFAYSDCQIPLAHEQRMMTPLEEGLLLQSLALKGHERVLEVGTGSGFLTALLSQLCKHVTSIDYYPDFTRSALQRLQAHQCQNVELLTGNAYSGWHDQAPYDIIIYSGALPTITETQRLQLSTGGRLFAIIGSAPVMQAQWLHEPTPGHWQQHRVFSTNLPSLIAKHKHNTFVF